MATILHNPEQGRYYRADGTVVLEVQKLDGGMRPPTITDALKNGWHVSVTEVLKTLDKPGLNIWKEQHLLEIADTLRRGEEALEDWIRRVSEAAKEFGSLAADRGKDIHAAVENYFMVGEEPTDPAAERAVREIRAHYGDDAIISEVSFTDPRGFAGTIDLEIGETVLGDIKTKDIAKFDKPSFDMGLQLGAYRLARPGRHLDQIIVDRDTGETRFFRWGEKWKRTQSQQPDELSEAFLLLFRFWCMANKFPVRELVL